MDLPPREAFVAPYKLIYGNLSTTESGINWAWETLNEISSISPILPTKAELIAFSIKSRAARRIDVLCAFHRLVTIRLEEHSKTGTTKEEAGAQLFITSPLRASATPEYPTIIDLTSSFESSPLDHSTITRETAGTRRSTTSLHTSKASAIQNVSTTQQTMTAKAILTREPKADAEPNANAVPDEPYGSNTSDTDLQPRAKRRRKLTPLMPTSESTMTTSSSNLNSKVTRSSRHSTKSKSTYQSSTHIEGEITTRGELNSTTHTALSTSRGTKVQENSDSPQARLILETSYTGKGNAKQDASLGIDYVTISDESIQAFKKGKLTKERQGSLRLAPEGPNWPPT